MWQTKTNDPMNCAANDTSSIGENRGESLIDDIGAGSLTNRWQSRKWRKMPFSMWGILWVYSFKMAANYE